MAASVPFPPRTQGEIFTSASKAMSQFIDGIFNLGPRPQMSALHPTVVQLLGHNLMCLQRFVDIDLLDRWQLYAHPVNLEQINKLVQNTPRPSLIPLPSNNSIGFLEVKGSVADPVEVALIIARGTEIIDSFHKLVFSSKPRLRNRRYACKHVHGVPSTPNLISDTKLEVQKNMQGFLAAHGVKYVFSTEKQIRKFISNPSITTILFDLPEWQQRGFHYSHQLNYLFKKGIAKNTLINICSPNNHKDFYLRGVHRNAVMTCRVRHGYQCALADALETYHHWRSPLNTRWIAADFLPTLVRPI